MKSGIKKASNRLLEAARKGDIQAILNCLEDGMDVNTTDESGLTPLMRAASYGHVDAINLLLDKGAKIDSQDLLGFTALFHAVSSEKPFSVEMLLKRGANPNLTDKNSLTATSILEEKYKILNALKGRLDRIAQFLSFSESSD